MKRFNIVIIFIFTIFSANTFAYGSGGGSKKACKKPELSQFTPPHLAVVEAQSVFSFFASSKTNPESIKVSVKNHPVEVTIDKKNNGFLIAGKLPEELQSTFARVNINATGLNNCKTKEGWLLNIKE
jgi:hypothetical protein